MRVNYIENTDCLIGMHEIPDESVDCVVTDCPYLLVGGGAVRKVSIAPRMVILSQVA